MDIECLANLANVIRFIEQHGHSDPPTMALDRLLLDWLAHHRTPEELASGIQAGCESGVLECTAADGALQVQLTPKVEASQVRVPPLSLLPLQPAWPDHHRRPRASELLDISKDRQSA